MPPLALFQGKETNMMLGRAWIVTGFCIACGAASLCAFDGKTPTVKEVMKKAHDNKSGLRAQIKTEAEKASPDWADIQKMTKEFVELASALESNKPGKGDVAGWTKQCQGYVTLVKALETAAGKKDAAAMKAANDKIIRYCGGCHKAHRE